LTIDYRPSTFYFTLLIFGFSFFTSGCGTYYQSNYEFNKEFESGKLKDALQTLRHQPNQENGHSRFLYFVNKGLVLSMMGQYEESNQYFEKAYLFWEDFKVNYFSEGASYLINQTLTVYRGEDHEHLILLYYKALNYLKLQKTEEALVECRRLNIRLQQLSDRYAAGNEYKHDAFIHNLMGIIYEADNDYNNAFIAYRTAWDTYKNEYESMFHVKVPEQLKRDLLRMAWLSGFKDEFERFKKLFNMNDFQYQSNEGGELIFFWHNGLAPVKGEWGINFMIDHGRGDQLMVYNSSLGLSFNFPKSNYSHDQLQGLSRLEFFHVAFPKYIERPLYFQEASLQANGIIYPLELTEDINKIAFKVLDERMGHEFARALVRVALKKASEYALKKEDKNMGALLGLFNSMTEKADTRNWQTLPHAIYYTRLPLPIGKTEVTLSLKGSSQDQSEQTFTYLVKKSQVLYHTFSSLETGHLNYGY
jgi:hypothetical protein